MNATNPIETLAGAMAHAAYEAFPEYTYKDRDWPKHDKWRSTLTREEMKTAKAPDDCWVEKVRKHSMYDVTVYSMFVQTWGSTALGFGGIGGQAKVVDFPDPVGPVTKIRPRGFSDKLANNGGAFSEVKLCIAEGMTLNTAAEPRF